MRSHLTKKISRYRIAALWTIEGELLLCLEKHGVWLRFKEISSQLLV